eukprot:11185225-Lingulodinium_polyedra.AAC.1
MHDNARACATLRRAHWQRAPNSIAARSCTTLRRPHCGAVDAMATNAGRCEKNARRRQHGQRCGATR